MELLNSKRLLYSATYVAPQLTQDEQQQIAQEAGSGLKKANLLLGLEISQEELGTIRERVHNAIDRRDDLEHVLRIAEQMATSQQSSKPFELAQKLVSVPELAILEFAKFSPKLNQNAEIKLLLDLYQYQQTISPIGWLHLERLEMFPVGVQRGELVFTVPLAPGEVVTLSHKEWSTSTQEFEDIVQDYFESYSERGVAEKTDASMSAESEAKRSTTLNFGASYSGSYAGVTLTTTFGLGSASEERESVRQSLLKSREVTEKASARTRKEHKISIKLETKKGVEDSSFRTVTNPGNTAIRIDYYRMMRKWRTDLYRYGLRLTYDITIPTPGARLWARWQKLQALDKELLGPFEFPLEPSEIAVDTNTALDWDRLAAHHGVQLDAPPPNTTDIHVKKVISTGDGGQEVFEFQAPAGYTLEETVDAIITYWGGTEPALVISTTPDWKTTRIHHQGTGGPGDGWYDIADMKTFGDEEKRSLHTIVAKGTTLVASFKATANLKPEHFTAWQLKSWNALRAAALVKFNDDKARKQEERDREWRSLAGKDTLRLRRLEREELLRLAMQWLLGPISPGITPATVADTLSKVLQNEQDFATTSSLQPNPTFSNVSAPEWHRALVFGELVKFIHQAIEWENLLYFLYPYFWGSEVVGRDKMLFEHIDAEHEKFLRAGYVRVVLPVRPGFEEDFTRLVETGSLAGGYTSPYLPIATDIANFARTNYAGIPPANPELESRPLLFPEQRSTWDTMQKVMKEIVAYKASNGSYPATLDDLPGNAPTDTWGNPFEYRQPGYGADFDLISMGKDNMPGGEGLDADISSAAGASLVATWQDYTPTSGIDIEIDTKPSDIA